LITTKYFSDEKTASASISILGSGAK